jgi:hypothetical protein
MLVYQYKASVSRDAVYYVAFACGSKTLNFICGSLAALRAASEPS